jgi:FKBP-type peptidyl-prolyl cis-trans isomerase FkpA/FKBP-type peptidyl-prolyl cis-trans isomerase FklB
MSNSTRVWPMTITALAVGLALAAQAPNATAAAAGSKSASAAATPAAPASDDDRTLYALGVLISRNLETFTLTPAELKMVELGLTDGTNHHPSLEAEAYQPQIQTLQRTRLAAIDEKQKTAGGAYLDKAAAQTGAQKTATGLVYVPIEEGKGATPDRTDRVSVTYEGKLVDGTVFDSTAKHGGQPVQMAVTGVIPCWTEALQLMKAGGKARVVCPSSLAYGDRGAPPTIMPGATLDFTISLLEVLPKQATPPAGAAAPAAPAAPGNAPPPKTPK